MCIRDRRRKGLPREAWHFMNARSPERAEAGVVSPVYIVGEVFMVPTLSCEEATYQLSSRLFKLKMLFLLALFFVVTGARAQSGPEEAVSGLMSSWNAKDAHAFASQFTEDATFVNVTGTIWIGNKDIEQRIANAAVFKSCLLYTSRCV